MEKKISRLIFSNFFFVAMLFNKKMLLLPTHNSLTTLSTSLPMPCHALRGVFNLPSAAISTPSEKIKINTLLVYLGVLNTLNHHKKNALSQIKGGRSYLLLQTFSSAFTMK